MDSATNLLVERSSSGSEMNTEKQEPPTANVKDIDSGLLSAVQLENTPLAPEDEQDIFEQVTMILRKRRGWGPEDSLSNNGLDLDLLEDDDDELVEEDDAGCPLPSTPEDTQLIEAEVRYFI